MSYHTESFAIYLYKRFAKFILGNFNVTSLITENIELAKSKNNFKKRMFYFNKDNVL